MGYHRDGASQSARYITDCDQQELDLKSLVTENMNPRRQRVKSEALEIRCLCLSDFVVFLHDRLGFCPVIE